MNREIKFRFYNVETGKMVYPNNNGSFADLVETDGWKVMQFTGLSDKNGKDIYEGDLLKYLGKEKKNYHLRQVIWDYKKARFIFHKIGLPIKGDTQIISRGRELKHEVIGNIYENPSLIK